MDVTLPSIATILGGFIVALGAYWAKRTDTRLEVLESKDQDLAERLARVEVLVQNIDKKLDHLVEKIDA